MLPRTVCTGLNLILAAPNCPVLGAWGILYSLPRVFCCVRGSDLESGGARCARRPYTNALRALASLRAGEIPLVELAIIVRIMESGPHVPVYSAPMPEVRTDMREGTNRAPFSDIFRLYDFRLQRHSDI